MRNGFAIGFFVAAFFECSVNTDALAQEPKPASTPGRAAMIYKPPITYPYEARNAKITGSGIVVVELDATGNVRNAYMGKSTGAKILDDAAIQAFRRARFTPGTYRYSPIKIPISFTMGGPVTTELRVQKKPMDDVLSHFLGKGTVLKGPIPAYPSFPPWTFKEGKGVYELYARSDGRISNVKILKTSGDATFDRVSVKTLQRWRLNRGPLIVVLPLKFSLTPTNYSVVIPKDL